MDNLMAFNGQFYKSRNLGIGEFGWDPEILAPGIAVLVRRHPKMWDP